jgi:hypothetical protein
LPFGPTELARPALGTSAAAGAIPRPARCLSLGLVASWHRWVTLPAVELLTLSRLSWPG